MGNNQEVFHLNQDQENLEIYLYVDVFRLLAEKQDYCIKKVRQYRAKIEKVQGWKEISFLRSTLPALNFLEELYIIKELKWRQKAQRNNDDKHKAYDVFVHLISRSRAARAG